MLQMTRSEAPPERLLVTVREAARMLSVCERTLWGLDIDRVRVGKRGVRYATDDLRRWIAERKATNNGD